VDLELEPNLVDLASANEPRAAHFIAASAPIRWNGLLLPFGIIVPTVNGL
jgi:hypothetical protein